MPEPTQAAPHKSTGSFASLLASFAGRLQSDPWDDSALADDVAVLTYEQALYPTRRSEKEASAKPESERSASPCASSVNRSGGGKKRRSASITIRVTAEEQAQLHERAVAAQLSVSAYLRSCVLEAESLRGQVKEALAQMQTDTGRPTVKAPSGWRKRFFPVRLRHRMSTDV